MSGTDIATLGIAISSTDALTAAVNMGKAADAADRLAASTSTLATATSGSATTQANAANTIAASTSTAATAADRLTASLEKQIALYGASSSAIANYNGAMAQMTTAELDHYQAQTAVLSQLQAESAQLRAFYADQQAAAASGAAFIASLEQQAATIGMNSTELLTYKAAQLGVTDAAAPLIAAIQGQASAMDTASTAAIALGDAEASAASRISLMVEASQAQLAAVTDSTGAMAAYTDSVSLLGQAAVAAEASTTAFNSASEAGVSVQGQATSAVLAYNKSVTDYAIAQRAGAESSSQFAAASNAVTESLARELAAIGATRAEMVEYDGAMKGFSEDTIATQVALVAMIEAQTASVAAAEAATAALVEEAAATDAVGASMAVTTRELAAMGREAARGDFSRMAGSASILGQNLGLLNGLFTPLGISIAATTAAIGISAVAADKAATNMEAYGKSVTDMATQTGTSTDFIQQFGFAIASNGGKATDEASALDTLTKKMGDAAQGSKTAQAYFTSLGISMDDIKNLGVDGVLDKISDAFAGSIDNQTKFTTGTYLLGSAYKELGPLMDQGSGALQSYATQLDALGMPSANMIAQMNDLNTESASMHAEWSATVLVAESQLLPMLLQLEKGLTDSGEASELLTDFFSGVKDVLGIVSVAVATVVTGFSQLGTAISTVATSANLLGQGKFTEAADQMVSGFQKVTAAGKAYETFVDGSNSAANPFPAFDMANGGLKAPALGTNSQGAIDVTALKAEVAQVQESLKEETDAVTAAQKVIADQYKSGDLSIDQYYTQNETLLEQNANNQIVAAVQEATLVQKTNQDRSLSAQQHATLTNEYLADLNKASAADAAYVAASLDNTAKQNEAWAVYGTTVTTSIQKQIDSTNAQAQSLQDQVAAFGLGKAAVDALAISRAQDALATDQQNLAQDALNTMLTGDTSDAMNKTEDALVKDIGLQTDLIAALQRRQNAQAALDQDNAAKKATDQATADWKKAADNIDQSLSNALVDGFSQGESAAKGFITSLEAMFKTLILKPIIAPIAGQLASYVTGAPAAAGGIGGISQLFGQAQGTTSVFGALDSGYNFISQLFGGTGIGSAPGSASASGGSQSTVSKASGLLGDASSGSNLYNALTGSGNNGGLMGILDNGYDSLTGSTNGISGAVNSVANLFGVGYGSAGSVIGAGSAGFTSGGAATVGSIEGTVATDSLGAASATEAGLGGSVAGEVASSTAGDVASTGGVFASGSAASSGLVAIPVVGWIAAGAMLDDSLAKQGWDPNNGTVDTTGQVLGSGILGLNNILQGVGLSSTAANILSGASTISALFGMQNPVVQSAGVQGDVTVAGGFQGQDYSDWTAKGGLFRSNESGTNLSPATSQQTQLINSTVTSTVAVVTQLADAIGDSGGLQEKLSDFNYAIRNDWSSQANITTSLTDLSNGLVDAVEPLDQYAQTGETLVQTATRLTAVFNATNTTADMLGETITQAFGQVGLAGDGVREALVTAAGGITQFTSETNTYFQDFYTSQQQNAENTKQLQEQFDDLNLTMPTTNAGFVQIVDSLDLTTSAGQNTFAALMALAPSFNTMTTAAQTAADDQQTLWNNYFGAVYTTSQQAAMSVKQMTAEFQALGVAMPTTDAGFQALVENIDPVTPAAISLQNALLALAPAFGSMVTATTSVATTNTQAASDQLTLWNSYYSAILTPQQQLVESSAELAAQFAQLGLALPTSTAAFQTLVNSIDATTTSGALLQNAVLGLAPAFGTLQTTLDTDVSTALTAVQTAYTAQTTAINTTITSITAYITTMTALKTSLSTGSLSTQTPQQIYLQEQATFESTNAAALGENGTDAADQATAQAALPQVAQDFLTASQTYNASSTAYTADYDEVQQALTDNINTSTQALTVQQQALAYANQQVQGILDLNTTAESISDALTAYFAAEDADQHVAAGTNAAAYNGTTLPGSLTSLEAAGFTAPSGSSEGTAWDAANGLSLSGNAANPESAFLTAIGMTVDSTGNYSYAPGYIGSASQIATNNADVAALGLPSSYLESSATPSASSTLTNTDVTPIQSDVTGFSSSNAGGLDSVPYDGYIAKLHKGERVQTAAEANTQKAAGIDWSSMGTSAGMMQALQSMAAQITALTTTAQKAATAQMTQSAAYQAQNVALMNNQTRQVTRVRDNTAKTANNAAKKSK